MSMEDFTMKRVRRQFTVEFKRNAVSLVIDEKRGISEVARNLNISAKTLSTWLRQYKEGNVRRRQEVVQIRRRKVEQIFFRGV